jgi:GrpB protein
VTEDSGNVTDDSGGQPKSVTFNQNRRSRSAGTTGHVQTESAVNFVRNTHVGCPPETAPLLLTDRLEDLGYVYRGDFGDSGERLFVRGIGALRTHHLHVVAPQGDQWTAYLALRDLLRADANSRDLYASVKRTLARRFKDDRKSYTDSKSATVQQLLLKAGGS